MQAVLRLTSAACHQLIGIRVLEKNTLVHFTTKEVPTYHTIPGSGAGTLRLCIMSESQRPARVLSRPDGSSKSSGASSPPVGGKEEVGTVAFHKHFGSVPCRLVREKAETPPPRPFSGSLHSMDGGGRNNTQFLFCEAICCHSSFSSLV